MAVKINVMRRRVKDCLMGAETLMHLVVFSYIFVGGEGPKVIESEVSSSVHMMKIIIEAATYLVLVSYLIEQKILWLVMLKLVMMRVRSEIEKILILLIHRRGQK